MFSFDLLIYHLHSESQTVKRFLGRGGGAWKGRLLTVHRGCVVEIRLLILKVEEHETHTGAI